MKINKGLSTFFFVLIAIAIVVIGILVTRPKVQNDVGDVPITTFEACVAAGNPIMESYPPKCVAHGQTFTQDIGL